MHISDWSSDVCSSDIMLELQATIDKDSGFCFGVVYAIDMAEQILDEDGYLYCLGDIVHNDEEVARLKERGLRIIDHEALKQLRGEKVLIRAHGEAPETYRTALENDIQPIGRAEEHTSELQSLMRISYAVFCLKKKKRQQNIIH